MKHTPGPWHGNGITSDDPEMRATMAVYSDRSEFICVMEYPFADDCPDKPSDETREANAALIAAAPELLEALYTAMPFVEDAENDPAFKRGAVRKVLSTLRATIAKAEGRLA